MADTAKHELVDAAKAATVTAATKRVEALSGRLQDQISGHSVGEDEDADEDQIDEQDQPRRRSKGRSSAPVDDDDGAEAETDEDEDSVEDVDEPRRRLETAQAESVHKGRIGQRAFVTSMASKPLRKARGPPRPSPSPRKT